MSKIYQQTGKKKIIIQQKIWFLAPNKFVDFLESTNFIISFTKF